MGNSEWEYQNQELLKAWYQEKISGKKPNLVVIKIICKGCGREFYTQIKSKKYCLYHLCGNRGYRKELSELTFTEMEEVPRLAQLTIKYGVNGYEDNCFIYENFDEFSTRYNSTIDILSGTNVIVKIRYSDCLREINGNKEKLTKENVNGLLC